MPGKAGLRRDAKGVSYLGSRGEASVKASSDGPRSVRFARRRKASSNVGVVPSGNHQSATYGPP
jgi:hypothetical protein